MVHVAGEVTPNSASHSVYDEMYAAYGQAYKGLSRQTFATLAAMQAEL